MSERSERHRHILDVLARNRIDSQDELQDLLRAEGRLTTQSTLSRDLRDLGVVKGNGGYRPPERDAAAPERLRTLATRIGGRLTSVDSGGNLIVLETASGVDAREVADRIRNAGLHQVVSALVADGAVLVVARSQAYAREVVRELRERPRRRSRRGV